MQATARELDVVEQVFVRQGWRITEFRQQPLRRLLRLMQRDVHD
jgi:hypothetical protein